MVAMRGLCAVLLLACLARPANAAGTCLGGSSTEANSTVVMSYSQFAAMADRLRSGSNNAKNVVSVVRKENTTEEGRNIYLFIVRPYLKNNKTANKKPSFWLQGGLAGNDFDSVSLLLDFVCETSSNCAGATCDYNFYVVPMANPDGYEYARTTNASWVKNRQKNNGSSCVGVNLNHNYPPDAEFATHGTDDPCSCDNRGVKPKSAKEVAALIEMKSCCATESSYALSMTFLPCEKDRLLWPKASTTVLIPENENYKNLARHFDDSGATELKPYSELKLASGTAMDFCYSADPKAYALTLMLKKSNVTTRALSITGKIIGGISNLVAVSGAEKETQANCPLEPASEDELINIDPTDITPLNLDTLRSGDCPSYASIVDYLQKKANCVKIDLVHLPLSYSNASIYMVIVKPYMHKNVINAKPMPDRHTYWLEGGLEANACDSVTTLLTLVDQLAHMSPKDQEKNIYYIVPLANPQGYEYARTVNSSWVKTREANAESNCRGVSLNNNFPPASSWSAGNTSTCACDCHYPGNAPGSSDEYQKLTILKQSSLKPCLSMSIVSANETCTLLFPKAHSTVDIDIAEFGKYEKVGMAYSEAVEAAGGQKVPYMTGGKWSLQSGTSMDQWYSSNPSTASRTKYSLSLAQVQSVSGQSVMSRGKQLMAGLMAMIAETRK